MYLQINEKKYTKFDNIFGGAKALYLKMERGGEEKEKVGGGYWLHNYSSEHSRLP